MKTRLQLELALAALCACPLLPAQMTGVSHPPETSMDAAPAPASAPAQKPSAAIPMTDTAQPAAAAQTAVQTTAPARATGADDNTYQSPAVTLRKHDIQAFKHNPDGDIVTAEPTGPNELAPGTLLHARVQQNIVTNLTGVGTEFTAELTENVTSTAGRVVLPQGAVLHGRVTELRGGKRVRGLATIHLEPEFVVLPDHTRVPVSASVVDTDQVNTLRINDEGSLVKRDHPKETVAAVGLATGGGAAAGALLGGGVGALVGAGVGAGVSSVVWLKQDQQAHLPADSLLVLSLREPVTVQPGAAAPDFVAQPSTSPGTLPATAAR